VLAKVDAAQARLEKIPTLLKRFRQSVLVTAVSGKLTEEWRAEHAATSADCRSIADEQFNKGITYGNFGKKLARPLDPTIEELDLIVQHVENWSMIRVGELCESVVPNRDKPKSFSGGYHWLLTPNFRENSIRIDYSKIEEGLNDDEVKKYNAKVISEGNVIMTCVGRLGLSAIVEEKSVINQQIHAFIVNDNIRAEYLAYCIRANTKYFESIATSTTVNYLNKTSCNSLPISLPTIEEQTEIVRRVESLFTLADTVEKQYLETKKRLDRLTQSLLAKAFRGELVPQDPNDEPAAELLKRIQAERNAQPPVKNKRAKSA
jgi:type I restriction enzyme S subunit